MKTTVLAALFTILVSASSFGQKQSGVFDAVRLNDSTTLAMCLNAGLKAGTANYNGTTLLMVASKSGSFAAAKLLLAHGAKIDAQNEMGNTALMEATLRGNEQMVALLLSAGANAGIRNEVGETALSIADNFEKTDIAKLFIEKHAGIKDNYAKQR